LEVKNVQGKEFYPTGGLSICATEMSQGALAAGMRSCTLRDKKMTGAWHGKSNYGRKEAIPDGKMNHLRS
jgi:hypothetical protein